jgi:hypothetical protein
MFLRKTRIRRNKYARESKEDRICNGFANSTAPRIVSGSDANATTYPDTLVQINHQSDATIFKFIILTFIYSSTCFGRFPAHHQELNDCSSSLWFYLRIVVIGVLCSWSGRPTRPRTQHGCHHDTMVKPEVTTAVISS